MAEQHRNIEQTLAQAVEEITEGRHSTPAILAIKQYTGDLITTAQYEAAIRILQQLADARKAKTTNILWIGSALKDIYFAEDATHTKPSFDRLLLDEMLFYYLKACKLYEKGYSIIRQDIKNLKED